METVDPGQDGRATFHVPVTGPASYRAHAGTLTSAVVKLAVAPEVTLSAARKGGRTVVRATVAPALPGATVQLQHYVRERFDFRPLQTLRARAGGRLTFTHRGPPPDHPEGGRRQGPGGLGTRGQRPAGRRSRAALRPGAAQARC